MNNDTRLAVAAHILALLSFAGSEYRSSDLLARSVNTNAVVVRRLTGQLKKAGLVEIRRGVGGTALNRKPEDITLLDVYKAVIPNPRPPPFICTKTPVAIAILAEIFMTRWKNLLPGSMLPCSKVWQKPPLQIWPIL